MTLPIKLLLAFLAALAALDIWHLASKDFMLLFRLASVAVLLFSVLVMHLIRNNIPDSVLLALAVLGATLGFMGHKDYGSLITLPIFSYFVGWLIRYVGQFFLGDKHLTDEDLRLLLVAGFFLDLNTIGSFFICVAIFSIVFAILMKRLAISTPYTIAICISIFVNFAHNIDLLRSF